MKRWPVVILVVMAVLGAVVPGCRHVPQYDSRLTAADSLMRTNPDSALALLEALNPSPADLAQSQYVIASDVIAGHSVDNGRTGGDVVVQSGVEYEIEASGTVTLQDGFKVEKGATFAVYPSSF